MPKDTVPAAEFMRHSGLVVYHIYKNDDINDPVREYWYSLWEYGSDNDAHGEDGAFDVRALPNSTECDTTEDYKAAIRAAIDAGYFDDWEIPDQSPGEKYGDLRRAYLQQPPAVPTPPDDKFTIPAEAHSDDHVISVKFDALEYFLQATAEELLLLAGCGFGGDYPADNVAQYLAETNKSLERLFDYLEAIADAPSKKDCKGFECNVEEGPAKAWLAENRPGVFALLAQDHQ